jgi:hypothetical protein
VQLPDHAAAAKLSNSFGGSAQLAFQLKSAAAMIIR